MPKSDQPWEQPLRLPASLMKNVTHYRDDERDELLAFRAAAYGPGSRQIDPARFDWLYESNPFLIADELRIMVARSKAGAIVGQQASIHVEVSVDGERLAMPWAVDLMVEDGLRGRGPAAALIATTVPLFPLIGILNLSEQGAKSSQRFGFRPIGEVHNYVRPLRPAALAGRLPIGRAGQTALRVAGPMATAMTLAAKSAAAPLGLRLEAASSVDERVDHIWESAKGEHRVLAVRTAETLAHWIERRPNRSLIDFHYLTWRGRAVGYIALREAAWSGGVVVVDYFAPRRWLAPLMTLAAAEATRRGATALACKTLNPGGERALLAAGFVRREAPGSAPSDFEVHTTEPRLEPIVYDPANWFITLLDGDLEPATGSSATTASTAEASSPGGDRSGAATPRSSVAP